MTHEPPVITADTRIWLFKTNPKYYSHIMKPVEGGPIQQYIQNNSHVCVHYKPGDIAIVWLTGDKGKGQLISAYYIITRIESKTQIQDAVVEDVKENEGHSFRLLDGSNRSEFIKTFEKRKQNSLQLVSAATGQEVPDALIAQKSIIGQQVRLVWRRMNRLVYGENLHFLTAPFHLDGYNHNAYRLYKEIRPEHRDYVVQMILAPPTMPYGSFPPPPPLTNAPAPDTQTAHIHNSTSSPPSHSFPSPVSIATTTSSSSPSGTSLSNMPSLNPPPVHSNLPSLSLSPTIHHSHTDPVELTDLAGTLQQDTSTDLNGSLSHTLSDSSSSLSASLDLLSRSPSHISGDIRVITPLTSITNHSVSIVSNPNNNSPSVNSNKRKRQTSKEKIILLSTELAIVRERLQKLENENYYLKYNLLQIASLGNQNQGLPYIAPLSSSPSLSSPPHSSSLSPSLSPSSPSSSLLSSHLSHLTADLNDDEDDDEDEDEDDLDDGRKKKKVDGLADLLD